MKASTKKDIIMEWENLCGKMEMCMRAAGEGVEWMGQVPSKETMAPSSKAPTKITTLLMETFSGIP